MSAQVVYKKEMASSVSSIVLEKELRSVSSMVCKNEMSSVSSIDRVQDPRCLS